MVGHPGDLAATATPEAEEHVRTLTGSGETLWRNSIYTDAELRRRVVADQIEFYRRTDDAPPAGMT